MPAATKVVAIGFAGHAAAVRRRSGGPFGAGSSFLSPLTFRPSFRSLSPPLAPVPSATAHAVLTDDYARMLADGMLLDESELFDTLMERCAAIEARVNASLLEGN